MICIADDVPRDHDPRSHKAGALHDLANVQPAAALGATIIADDCTPRFPHVIAAWTHTLKSGVIERSYNRTLHLPPPAGVKGWCVGTYIGPRHAGGTVASTSHGAHSGTALAAAAQTTETAPAAADAARTAARMHVLFVALYPNDGFVEHLSHAVAHLNSTVGSSSSSRAASFHALVERASPRLAPSLVTQHVLTEVAPAEALAVHRNISRGKHHGAAIYLYKPILYKLLPTHIEQCIVLDLDIAFTPSGTLHGLWQHFESFAPTAVLGLVHEQAPTYGYNGYLPGRATQGYNGGVQLHHLSRMRAAAAAAAAATNTTGGVAPMTPGHAVTYDEALHRCASGACWGWDRVEPGLGDQTLYTYLCTVQPQLCQRLPCGWNRQMSTRYFTAHGFQQMHACADADASSGTSIRGGSSCHLLHFNQPLLEGLVPRFQRVSSPHPTPLTCDECIAAVDALENRTRATASANPKFSWAASKVHMAKVIKGCCCGEDTPGSQ